MARVVLLLSDHPQTKLAELYAKRRLDVLQVIRHPRDAKKVRETLVLGDFLLNFLSAPRVRSSELAKFKTAINFHPAPPEYPGVGSASLALYDKRTEHGATAHLMDPLFDHGEIVRVRRFPIRETGYTALWNRSIDECLKLFQEIVRDISHGVPIVPMNIPWERNSYSRKEFELSAAFREVAA